MARGAGRLDELRDGEHRRPHQLVDQQGRCPPGEIGGRDAGLDLPAPQPFKRHQCRQHGVMGAGDPGRKFPLHRAARRQPTDPGEAERQEAERLALDGKSEAGAEDRRFDVAQMVRAFLQQPPEVEGGAAGRHRAELARAGVALFLNPRRRALEAIPYP